MGSIKHLFLSVERRQPIFGSADAPSPLEQTARRHSAYQRRRKDRKGGSDRDDKLTMGGPNECTPDRVTTALRPAVDLTYSEPCHSNKSQDNPNTVGTSMNSPITSTTTTGSTLFSGSAGLTSESTLLTSETSSTLDASHSSLESSGSQLITVESQQSQIISGLTVMSTTVSSPTIHAESSFLSDNPAETAAPASSSSIPPPLAAATKSTKNTGAIIGGVIGGVALLILLILGTILFLRQRKLKRTPASAEFRDRHITRPWPLAAQGSDEDFHDIDERATPPPPFSPGGFNQPLYEKLEDGKNSQPSYGMAV